jgi:sugar (pentulose or hexulose) kinase
MFLGLDGSTQALKASLLTSTLDVRREVAVNFDADLPHYKTRGGVHHGPDGQVHSPVEMVIEAFDLLFSRMKEQGWPLEDVMGVAAAGQVSLVVPHRRYELTRSNMLQCTGIRMPLPPSAMSTHPNPFSTR